MLQIYNSETLQNDCIMKKLTRLLLGAFCVLLFSFKGTAQNFTVTGQVISQTTNAPLQGVTVNVKGTSVSVMTDENGKYSISVPKPGSVLSISYVGMVTLEKTVQGTGSQDFFDDVRAQFQVFVEAHMAWIRFAQVAAILRQIDVHDLALRAGLFFHWQAA